MRKFSESEKNLLEEMFSSSAKIVCLTKFGKMDTEKMGRYVDFFRKRYQDIPGMESCVTFFLRVYHNRLATDTLYASPLSCETTFLYGKDFTECMSFEEILLLGKGIFRSKDYKAYYEDVFKNASKRTDDRSNHSPAHLVMGCIGIVACCFMAFKYVYNISEGKSYINDCINELNAVAKSEMFGYLNEADQYIYFGFIDDCFSELLKLDKNCFDRPVAEKKKEA